MDPLVSLSRELRGSVLYNRDTLSPQHYLLIYLFWPQALPHPYISHTVCHEATQLCLDMRRSFDLPLMVSLTRDD